MRRKWKAKKTLNAAEEELSMRQLFFFINGEGETGQAKQQRLQQQEAYVRYLISSRLVSFTPCS